MKSFLGVGCVVLLALSIARPALAQDDEIGLAIGASPPASIQVTSLDGQPMDIGSYVGKKPLLVEFWATWCPICAELLPRVVAAHKVYGDRVDFLVVAVGVNETPASIKRHLAKHPIPFTFFFDGKGVAVRAFEAPQTSYVVVLNAKGKAVYTGLGSDQDIEAAVKKAL